MFSLKASAYLGAILGVVAYFAILHVLRLLLPRMLQYVRDLSTIVEDGWLLTVKHVDVRQVGLNFTLRNCRICLSIRGVRLVVVLDYGEYTKADDRGEEFSAGQVTADPSWLVQIGSRYHPLWQLLTPWLKLTRYLLAFFRLFSVAILDCEVEICFTSIFGSDDVQQHRRSTETDLPQPTSVRFLPPLIAYVEALDVQLTPFSRSPRADLSQDPSHSCPKTRNNLSLQISLNPGRYTGFPSWSSTNQHYRPLLCLGDFQSPSLLGQDQAVQITPHPKPLIQMKGSLLFQVDLPWPPQLARSTLDPCNRGFGYLSRPPLLPECLRVVLGQALRVEAELVTLLEAMEDLRGRCAQRSAGRIAGLESVHTQNIHPSPPSPSPPPPPLPLQEPCKHQERGRAGGLSLPDVLVAAEWVCLLVECPLIELGLSVDRDDGEAFVLRLTGLQVESRPTVLEEDRLEAGIEVSVAGIEAALQESKIKIGDAPMGLRTKQVSMALGGRGDARGKPEGITRREPSILGKQEDEIPIVQIASCLSHIGVGLRYEDVIGGEDVLIRCVWSLGMGLKAGSIKVGGEEAGLRSAADVAMQIASRVQREVTCWRLPHTERRASVAEGEQANGHVQWNEVGYTLTVECSALEASYYGCPSPESFVYGIEVLCCGGRGDMAAQEGTFACQTLVVETTMRRDGTTQRHACQSLLMRNIEASTYLQTEMAATEADNLEENEAEEGEEDGRPRGTTVRIAVDALCLEWNPLSIAALTILPLPYLSCHPPPSPNWFNHQPIEKTDLLLAPSCRLPLTLSLAEEVLSGVLEGGIPSIEGSVASLTVRFPYCVTHDLGDMHEEEVWVWLQRREADMPPSAADTNPTAGRAGVTQVHRPAESAEDGWKGKTDGNAHDWVEEIVRIRKTIFRADATADARQPVWGFVLEEVSVGHMPRSPALMAEQVTVSTQKPCQPTQRLALAVSPPPVEQVYCQVGQFATRQSAQVIDICGHKVTLTWSPVQQLRVIKISQDVTRSVWVSMLRIRQALWGIRSSASVSQNKGESTGQPSSPEYDVNSRLDDAAALTVLANAARKWAGSKENIVHRLFVSDLTIEANLAGCEMALCLGLAASEDLPEVWAFGDVTVSLQGEPTLLLHEALVRHTVEDRPDLIFGEAHAELRVRRDTCLHANLLEKSDQHFLNWAKELLDGREGHRIDCHGLTLRIGRHLPLMPLTSEVPFQIMALGNLLSSLPADWIPNDPAFSRLFKRPTFRTHVLPHLCPPPPCVWLRLEDVTVEVADDPFESWIGYMQPYWLQELKDQTLRTEQCNRQTDYILKTSGTTDVDIIRASMEQKLYELNSSFYQSTIHTILPSFRAARPCLLRVQMTQLHATLYVLDNARELVHDLDECPLTAQGCKELQPDSPSGVRIVMSLLHLRTHLRWTRDPFLALASITLTGHLIMVPQTLPEQPTPSPLVHSTSVTIFPGLSLTLLGTSLPPHVYTDLQLGLTGLQLTYFPGIEILLEEMVTLAARLQQPVHAHATAKSAHSYPAVSRHSFAEAAAFTPLPMWDQLRALLHGRIYFACYGAHVSILATERAVDPRETAMLSNGSLDDCDNMSTPSEMGRLALECSIIVASYSCSQVSMSAMGIILHRMPSPADMPPLVEIPSLTMNLTLDWLYAGGSYRAYSVPPGERQTIQPSIHIDMDDPFSGFRSSGVRIYVNCKIGPKETAGAAQDARALCQIPQVEESLRHSADVTTVIFYGDQVPWYSSWILSFLRELSRPRVIKKKHVLAPLKADFRSQIRLVEICPMSMSGVNVLVYDTHAIQSERHGLRVSITGILSTSITISEEAELPNPFLGKILVPSSERPFWSINHLSLIMTALEARLCSPTTDPGGDFLFAIATLEYQQSTKMPKDLRPIPNVANTEQAATARPTLSTRYQEILKLYEMNKQTSSRHREAGVQALSTPDKVEADKLAALVSATDSDEKVSVASKQPDGVGHLPVRDNGASQFSDPTFGERIGMHNPEAQQLAHSTESFLHSVIVDGFHFLLTLQTRNALIDLVEAYLQMVLSVLPSHIELALRPPLALLPPAQDHKPFPSTAQTMAPGRDFCPDRPSSLIPYGHAGSFAENWIHNLFSIEVNRTQIQVMDTDYHACAVFAIDYACIEGRVAVEGDGSNPPPHVNVQLTTQEKEHYTLQCLAARELKHYSESISLIVRSSMLFVAPTDVDIGVGLVWLPDLAFKHLPARSEDDPCVDFGLLRPVLAPLPLELYILAVHDGMQHQLLRLKAPSTIAFSFDDEQFNLLRRAAERAALAPLPNLKERTRQAKSRRLRRHLVQRSGLRWVDMGPEELWREKTALLWQANQGRYLRPGIKGLELEARAANRGPLARDAQPPTDPLSESYGKLHEYAEDDLGVPPSWDAFEQFASHWATEIDESVGRCEAELSLLLEQLQGMIKEAEAKRHLKPNSQIQGAVKGVSLKLKSLQRPLCVVLVEGITASFTSFESEASKMTLDVQLLRGNDLRASAPGVCGSASPPTGTVPAVPIIFPATIKGQIKIGGGAIVSQAADTTFIQDAHRFIHLQANMGSPVGGLTVLRHLEVNCCPFVVRLSRGLVVQLYDFVKASGPIELNMSSDPLSEASSPADRRRRGRSLEGRKIVVPAVLLPGKASASQHIEEAEAAAAASLLWGKHHKRNVTSGTYSAEGSSSSARQGGLRNNWGSKASLEADKGKPGGANKGTETGGPPSSTGSTPAPIPNGLASETSVVPGSDRQEVAELKTRALDNIVFRHFRLGEVNIFFSYSGAEWGNLEDVDHLHLKLHPIVYSNKTFTIQEFLLRLQKDVILDLLSQVNRNFANLGAFLQQSFNSIGLGSRSTEEEGDAPGPSTGGISDLEPEMAGSQLASIRQAAAEQYVRASSSKPAAPGLASSEAADKAGKASGKGLPGVEDKGEVVEDRKRLLFGGEGPAAKGTNVGKGKGLGKGLGHFLKR